MFPLLGYCSKLAINAIFGFPITFAKINSLIKLAWFLAKYRLVGMIDLGWLLFLEFGRGFKSIKAQDPFGEFPK